VVCSDDVMNAWTGTAAPAQVGGRVSR